MENKVLANSTSKTEKSPNIIFKALKALKDNWACVKAQVCVHFQAAAEWDLSRAAWLSPASEEVAMYRGKHSFILLWMSSGAVD